MKTRYLATLLIFGLSTSLQADEIDLKYTGYNDIEIASLMQPQENKTTSNCDCGNVVDCFCPQGGLVAGVDLTLFDVYANHGAGGTGTSWFEDFDVIANGRYWFGYERGDGIGLQGRFFRYYNDNGDIGLPNDYVSFELYDLEVTGDLNLDEWDFLLFGGMRGGQISWSDETQAPGYCFEGLGATLGTRVSRHLNSRWSLIGGIRYSALFGDTSDENGDFANDTAVHAWETQLGCEWARPLRNGSRFVIRAMWEYQVYNSLSGNVDNDIDPEDVDITLAGPVFTFAFER